MICPPYILARRVLIIILTNLWCNFVFSCVTILLGVLKKVFWVRKVSLVLLTETLAYT